MSQKETKTHPFQPVFFQEFPWLLKGFEPLASVLLLEFDFVRPLLLSRAIYIHYIHRDTKGQQSTPSPQSPPVPHTNKVV